MSQNELTASARLRLAGKRAFERSFDPTVHLSMRVERARDALRRFNEARAAAATQTEAALAARNAGLAGWRVGALLADAAAAAAAAEDVADRNARLSTLEQALETLIDARQIGADRPPQWKAAVIANINGVCLSVSSTLLSVGNYDERARRLEQLIRRLKSGSEPWAFVLLVQLTDTYFKAAVCEVEDSRAASQFFPAAIRYFKECHYPLEEAKKLFKKLPVEMRSMELVAEWSDQLDQLDDDVPVNLRIAEAFQSLCQGDELLRAALEDEEALNMDGVYCAVDKFREAAVTCDNDIELVATVYSRLGGVYLDVFKVEKRAHEYLMKCAELAESLMPRNFHGRPWFDEAMSKLSNLQWKQQQAEEAEKRKLREPYLKELTSELEQLEVLKSKSAEHLILQLPIKFPPQHKTVAGLPTDKKELDKMDRVAIKKLLQKLVFHYHPDHVDKEQFGMKYFVLCEEVTKVITGKYEYFK